MGCLSEEKNYHRISVLINTACTALLLRYTVMKYQVFFHCSTNLHKKNNYTAVI